MNPFKSIIFDFGGVIERYPKGSFTEFLFDEWKPTRRVSLSAFRNAFWKNEGGFALGGEPFEDFFERFSSDIGESFSAIDKNRFFNAVQRIASIDADLLELIQSLKKGYRLLLLSNNYPGRSEAIRKRIGKHFDAMYFSNEMGVRKPGTEAFQFVLRKEGLSANECVFVDDIAANVLAAKKLGFHAIEFEGNQKLSQSLKKLGVELKK